MRTFKTITGRLVDVDLRLEYEVLLRHDLEHGANCTSSLKAKVRSVGHVIQEPEGIWSRCIRRTRNIVIWALDLNGGLMRVDARNAYRKGQYGILVIGIVSHGLTYCGENPGEMGSGINLRWRFDDILGVFTYDVNAHRKDRTMIKHGVLDFKLVDEETQEIH